MSEHQSPKDGGEGHAGCVLLAAPEGSTLWEVRELLSGEGLEVASATSGVECLRQLREGRPDVLLLDPDIPWGQGEGVLAMMWQQADIPSVPVVIAKSDTEQPSDFAAAPFTSLTATGDAAPAEIVGRVREVLAARNGLP